MIINKNILLLLIFYQCINFSCLGPSFDPKLYIHSINYTYNSKYFSNYSLYTKDNAVFLDAYLKRPIDRGVKASLDFGVSLGNFNKFQTVFSHTFDICSFLSSSRESSFLKAWFKVLKSVSNLGNKCPLVPQHYVVNGFSLRAVKMPIILIQGEYEIYGRAFNEKSKSKNEKEIADWKAKATIT